MNPTKSYLEYLSLPNDDSTLLSLKQVAAIALSHLDRIAEPYNSRKEVGRGYCVGKLTVDHHRVHSMYCICEQCLLHRERER